MTLTLFELGSFLDPGDDADWLVGVDWGDGSDVAQFSVASAGSLGSLEHNYVEGGSFTVSVTVTEDGGSGQSGSATFGVDVVDPAPLHSIAGYVYADVNNDGVKDPQELVLPNVPITLSGPVNLTVMTGSDGGYAFTNLPDGTYHVEQLQPLVFLDGIETQGTPRMGDVEDNRFIDLQMQGSPTEAINYNFGERGLRAEFVSKQFFLASTPSMGELMETLDIQGGGWRSFTSAYTGTLITTVRDETGMSDEMVEIYDASLLPVSLGQSVLEAELVEGESYVLHVADTASSIQVSLQMQLDLSGVYTNPVDRLDVSGDGLISPVDALLVVNRLNQSGAKRVYGPQSEAPFHDTNADGLVSPLDALLVINRLNAPRSVEAEAAGPAESAPVIVAALVNDTASEEAFNSDRITSDPTIAIGVGGVFPHCQCDGGIWPAGHGSQQCTASRRDLSARSNRHQRVVRPLGRWRTTYCKCRPRMIRAIVRRSWTSR